MITGELLGIDAVRSRLATSLVGRQLHVFGDVDSTNTKLRALARSGAPAGTVVLAEGQTAGRGRHGQEWFSPSGVNLYASVLFRPVLHPREVAVFSFIASLALVDTIKDAGASPGIKWPNDILVGGKKVAGVLVECATRGEAIDYVILGVGVNLNVDPEVLRTALGPAGGFATSLAAVTGREIDRNGFVAAYLNHLDAWYQAWQSQGPQPVLTRWADFDILTGRRVQVRGHGGRIEGRARGLNAHGALVVEDPLGRRHALTDEEVRLAD